MKRINKVAVLGAGTMGARIAAHFANAGVPELSARYRSSRCRRPGAQQDRSCRTRCREEIQAGGLYGCIARTAGHGRKF